MWWTQWFAIVGNVILWGWIFVALFAPGVHDIQKWAQEANLRVPSTKIKARHRDGRVREDVTQVDDRTGSHRIVEETQEVAA
jgi:hypothetical protein